MTGRVRLRDSHGPPGGKPIPEQERCPTPYATSTIPAEHEKLRDVEGLHIQRRGQSSRGERETDNRNATANQEWKSTLRLGPIHRQMLIAETSVVSQFQAERIAQIVAV